MAITIPIHHHFIEAITQTHNSIQDHVTCKFNLQPQLNLQTNHSQIHHRNSFTNSPPAQVHNHRHRSSLSVPNQSNTQAKFIQAAAVHHRRSQLPALSPQSHATDVIDLKRPVSLLWSSYNSESSHRRYTFISSP
jgi:hypothetical protein